VRDFRPGDAVMAVHSAPCGSCFYCQAGQENLEPSETKVPAPTPTGSSSPPIVARNVYPKPDHLLRGGGVLRTAFLRRLRQPRAPMRPGETRSSSAPALSACCTAAARSAGSAGSSSPPAAGAPELARRLGAAVVNVEREDALPQIAAPPAAASRPLVEHRPA
jgi:L-iditol 2-dehydrogenase